MTEHGTGPHPDDEAAGAPSEPPRVIPDGGLGSAMPAWLQQPPAWKRPVVSVETRQVPPPDISPIDPRTMLDVEDLPGWLQAIALRNTVAAAGEAGEEPLADTGMESEQAESMPVIEPIEPVAGDFHDELTREMQVEPAYQRLEMSPPVSWWMSDRAVGVLFVAIVLTIIYVILVASGIL